MHLFRESTVKIHRWPEAWKILLCAVGAMALAVVVMAWHLKENVGYRHPVHAQYAETQRW